jgi:acetyl-CoA acyltransferase
MNETVIVSSVRTAVGKAVKGTLRETRPDDMAADAIRGALARVPALKAEMVDDVILGCAMPEAEQGMNVARTASLLAGVPHTASAMTINRFCSSGLQAIALAAQAIETGSIDVAVAGGTESMSLVPMGGNKVSPNPSLVETYPDVYLTTGLVAENHAREHAITRDEQDAFALRSHERALAAVAAGRFADEIVPLSFQVASAGPNGTTVSEARVTHDEGPRRDTSLAALGKLRPAFHANGTVTAGNSSQTSDGAAAVLVTSGRLARERGLTPLGRFVCFATAGVEPERFGIGPVPAIRKALKMAGLKLEQIDLVELNEAFAAQVLACLRELPIDADRLNVNGGAIALGHPLGCTGARMTTSILHEMQRRQSRYGLVTMCVGGGMGAAGIFERL